MTDLGTIHHGGREGPVMRQPSAASIREAEPSPVNGSGLREWASCFFPPDRPLSWSARGALAVVAMMLLGVVVVVTRARPNPLSTLWAEDGAVFFSEALDGALPGVLFQDYAGYLHVLPRLVGQAAAQLPLHWADTVMSGTAITVVAVLALVSARAIWPHVHSPAASIAVGAVFFLVPAGSTETLANAANLHWYLIAATFFILTWLPRNWPLVLLSVIVVAAAALSDPLVALLAPLVGLRLLATRGVRDRWVAVAWAGGLAVQAASLLTAPPSRDFESGMPLSGLLRWTFARIVAGPILGDRVDAASGVVVIGAGLIVIGMFALVLAVQPRGPQRVGRYAFSSLAIITAVVLWVAPVALTGVAAPRYATGPVILVVTAFVAMADNAIQMAASPVQKRGLQLACGVAVAVVVVASFAQPTAPTAPRWDEELLETQKRCDEGDSLRGIAEIAPPGWQVSLECGVIRDGG